MNRSKIKIGIIGLGKMGQALLKSLVSVSYFQVYGYDKDRNKQRSLRDINNFSLITRADLLISNVDIVILAIKPQDIKDFLRNKKVVKALLSNKPLLISIAAGVPTSFFEEKVRKVRVIRVMPNLAVRVKESISFLSRGKFVQDRDMREAEAIFKTVGETVFIEENMLNKVTSISGSGPGYIYYFMDCIYETAKELGFERKIAEKMVKQTFLGAVKLSLIEKKSFSSLVKDVASKGGTTERALNIFKEYALKNIIKKAIKSAYQRGEELSLKR